MGSESWCVIENGKIIYHFLIFFVFFVFIS
jgi:hypothetical protein